MLKNTFRFFLGVLPLLFSISLVAQGTCSETYIVESIDYLPPFDYATLEPVDGDDANPNDISINITRDDYWSQIIDFDFDDTPDTPPFRFCYFGNFYDKALVNSNGAITFSVGGANGNGGQYPPEGSVSWGFSGGIPYAGSDARTKLSIFGVLQDTNPATSGPAYDPVTNPNGWRIQAKLTGNFPCRMLVFSIYNLGQFQCGTGVGPQTYQMVLYETSNVIEIYVDSRTACTGWNNGGQGIIGIQNEAGDSAFTPPGRNGGAWSAQHEAWRFKPDNILGIGEDRMVCDSEEVVLTAFLEDLPGIAYQWYWDDGNGNPGDDNFVLIPGATSSVYRVIPSDSIDYSGTYKVIATAAGCLEVEDEVEVLFMDPPEVNDAPDLLYACDPSNGGHVAFDLHEADDDITEGDDTLEVTYYGTYDNARYDVDELPNPYVNDDPWNDEVYARVVDPDTGCHSVVELELQVGISPVLLEPEIYRLCEMEIGVEYAEFDLTSREEEMLNGLDPTFVDFHYFEAEEDAIDAGEAALDVPFFGFQIGNPASFVNVRTPQIIYVLAVGNEDFIEPYNGGKGCYDIVELTLIADPLPAVVQLAPYELCDDVESGSTTDRRSYFDLTSRDSEINGGDTSTIVTWYDEDPSQDPIPNPVDDASAYLNTSTPQTVFALVTNEFGCSSIISLTLVVNPLPKPEDPNPMEICDFDDNGIAEFDLTEKDDEIIDGDDDLEVPITYYTTQRRAERGNLEDVIVDGLYTNSRSPFNDTVWARVKNTETGCVAVISLDLIVHPLPDRPTEDFGDLTVCDSGNGSADFDLTVNTPFVYGDQETDEFNISYHRTEQDAEIGQDRIGNPSRFPSTGQTIWVRLKNIETGCVRISEFELIVGVGPSIVEPSDMELCDETDGERVAVFNLHSNTIIITGNDGTLDVFYYATQADQQNDNPIADTATRAFENPRGADGLGITPYTIYIDVVDEGGCVTETTLDLKVLPNPVVAEPSPLVICDDDNDGFGEFEFTDDLDDEIANGNSAIVVSYHETELDAEMGEFPLDPEYQNIVRYSQTIYVRAAYELPPNESGCFTVVPLELIVSPIPVVPLELPDLVECDLDGGGHAVFDLTEQEDFIYGGEDPADFDLTYHLTQGDANLDENRIATPGAYTNTSNPQEIYYRLAFVGDDKCYASGHFTLIVADEVVAIPPTPLSMCSVGEPDDPIATAVFDLTVKNPEITGGASEIGVSYFLTEGDAENNEDRIDPETAFENTENPQRVYVRVSVSNSDCVSYTSLLLKVLPNPDPVTPTPLVLCDDNNDGYGDFMLTDKDGEIANGNPAIVVTYHVTELDAENGGSPLASPYRNIVRYSQTVYARATFGAEPNTTGCFTVVPLELIISLSPVVPEEEVSPYLICEINTDGLAQFDLTAKIPEILGDQSPDDFDVNFYLRPSDAANGDNAIVEPERHWNRVNGNTQNPQTIYTGISVPGSECYIGGVQSFELIVKEGVIATPPAEPFVICDNLMPSDGIAEFDLEDYTSQAVVDLRGEILSGQDPNIYSLDFYETESNAIMGIDAIEFPYINTINPQIIYARVTNENPPLDPDVPLEPKCFEVVEVVLKVEELPEINLEDEYRLCVDENGNPIVEESGITSPPVIDTHLDPSLYTFEWMHEGVLLPGEDGPSLTVHEGGEYTVIATEIATGCDTIAVATVWISAPPATYSADVVNGAFADSHAIEVTAEGIGSYEFQLNNGPFQEGNIFQNIDAGSHTVTIRDVNGCGSVTIEVGIIDYPSYFTPNNDGYHDTWNITGIDFGDPYAKIYIFDRSGKLLKQLSPTDAGWDGTFNGSPLPSNDYWFQVKYTEDGQRKEYKGHFTLKR